jgi:adenine C2-methylase RlmN of 23S rRNA A2503 and tRNA A37
LELIPAARAWPLDALMEACRYYTGIMARKIFFEWTLIAGTNDSPAQARSLADLLHGIPAHVNLIPLNPTTGYAGASSRPESIARFQSLLRERGIPSTVRQRRGIEIAAGCGQLAGSQTAARVLGSPRSAGGDVIKRNSSVDGLLCSEPMPGMAKAPASGLATP